MLLVRVREVLGYINPLSSLALDCYLFKEFWTPFPNPPVIYLAVTILDDGIKCAALSSRGSLSLTLISIYSFTFSISPCKKPNA